MASYCNVQRHCSFTKDKSVAVKPNREIDDIVADLKIKTERLKATSERLELLKKNRELEGRYRTLANAVNYRKPRWWEWEFKRYS